MSLLSYRINPNMGSGDHVKAGNAGAQTRKIQMEMRIEAVRRLMVKGVKKGIEIQTAMERQGESLTLRTIYRYKKIITKRAQKKMIKRGEAYQTVEQLAFNLKEQFEEVMRSLWAEYHRAETKKIKCDCGREHEMRVVLGSYRVSALSKIRETTKDYVEIMQSLGLTYKEPEKHQVIGADGKPVDPNDADKKALDAEFKSFLKAKYQNPKNPDKVQEGEIIS